MIEAGAFLLFLVAALLIAVTPGPGIFYVAARTLAGGRSEGLASSFGTGLGGLPGLALTAGLSLSILSPPVIGALWLKEIHNPRPPQPGVCAKCGYSLAGLESNRCPECGAEYRNS